MSQYEYTDKHDRTLSITGRSVVNRGYALLGLEWSDAEGFIHIAHADIPAVAAELLKAAGQESVIVPKSKSKVVERPSGQIQCGSVTVYSGVDHASLMSSAAAFIAIADYVGSKAAREAAEKAEAEAAEKKLQARRDALACLFGYGEDYDELDPTSPLVHAINYIIELEDGK